jgi:hypothetical protein
VTIIELQLHGEQAERIGALEKRAIDEMTRGRS